MTAVTYQRNRIASSAETVPIRRYILLRVRDFFHLKDGRKTRGIWKRPGQHQARSMRPRTKEIAEDNAETRTTVAGRRVIDFLSSCRVYDISPRFDTTRNLSECHACLSRGQDGQLLGCALALLYLFVEEEDTERMLPGYRGKPGASRNVKKVVPCIGWKRLIYRVYMYMPVKGIMFCIFVSYKRIFFCLNLLISGVIEGSLESTWRVHAGMDIRGS